MRLVILPTDMNRANNQMSVALARPRISIFVLCLLVFVIEWADFHLYFRLLLIHVCSLRTIWETYAIKLALNGRQWIP